MIIFGAFGVRFGAEVEIYFGDHRVEHRKVRRRETELEVAIELLEHFKRNGLFTRWLKIDQMTDDRPQALYKMRTEDAYLQYLNSDYVKQLEGLERKVIDLPLNEMFRKESK